MCGELEGTGDLTQALLPLVSEPLAIWAVQDLGLWFLRDSDVCMWNPRKRDRASPFTHADRHRLQDKPLLGSPSFLRCLCPDLEPIHAALSLSPLSHSERYRTRKMWVLFARLV